MIFCAEFRSLMMGRLVDRHWWIIVVGCFPDTIRLRRKELIINMSLYTYCRSSPLKKGFLERSWWGLHLGLTWRHCSSWVAWKSSSWVSFLGAWGRCRYHFLIFSSYEGHRWGRIVFRMRRAYVLDSLRFLVRKRIIKTSIWISACLVVGVVHSRCSHRLILLSDFR